MSRPSGPLNAYAIIVVSVVLLFLVAVLWGWL
jgi:hypothetical protein